MSELRHAILLELYHGPLNDYELAGAIGFPPFSVRAELRSLKRERAVLEVLTTQRHTWELSNHGYELVNLARQLVL